MQEILIEKETETRGCMHAAVVFGVVEIVSSFVIFFVNCFVSLAAFAAPSSFSIMLIIPAATAAAAAAAAFRCHWSGHLACIRE